MIVDTIIHGKEDVGKEDEQMYENKIYIVFTWRINIRMSMRMNMSMSMRLEREDEYEYEYEE